MKKSSPSSAGKSTGRLGNTRLGRWLTGQPDQAPERDRLTKAAGGISGGLQSLIKTLHLEKVLEGSVFLHPVLFCLLAAALIPFLPTMALLALVLAAGLALILTYGMGRGEDWRLSAHVPVDGAAGTMLSFQYFHLRCAGTKPASGSAHGGLCAVCAGGIFECEKIR